MRKQMPSMFGAQKAQDKLLNNIIEHFTQASVEREEKWRGEEEGGKGEEG